MSELESQLMILYNGLKNLGMDIKIMTEKQDAQNVSGDLNDLQKQVYSLQELVNKIIQKRQEQP